MDLDVASEEEGEEEAESQAFAVERMLQIETVENAMLDREEQEEEEEQLMDRDLVMRSPSPSPPPSPILLSCLRLGVIRFGFS